jgi:3-hydroxyacyl-[acyl-carrier-protein] dehydratase
LLAFATAGRMRGDDVTFYFVGIDKARFRRPVTAGDQLALTVTFVRRIRDMWKFAAEATVDGEVAASADLMVAPKDGR